jgi:hypothetical protein
LVTVAPFSLNPKHQILNPKYQTLHTKT